MLRLDERGTTGKLTAADTRLGKAAAGKPAHAWSPLVQALFFGLAYLAAAQLGEWVSFDPSHIATFWPPAGLFVGVLLRAAPRRWPLFIVAGALANIVFDMAIQGHPAIVALGLPAANALEAFTGAGLLRRFWFRGRMAGFATLADVLAVSIVAGLAAPLIGATVGAAVMANRFNVAYSQTWVALWCIHAVGVLLVAPIVLVLPAPSRLRSWWSALPLGRRFEALVMLVVVAAYSVFFIFAVPPQFHVTALVVFILLWPALRLGPLGVATAVTTMAIIATRGTALGHGAFADPTQNTAMMVLLLEAFLGVAAVSAHILAAVTGERQSALAQLAAFNAELEARVGARTAELRESEERARRSLGELRSIYDGAPVGLCVFDRDLRFVRINERLAQFHGVPAAEHIGRTVREMLPDLADTLEPIYRRVLATGEPTSTEFEAEMNVPGIKRSWTATRLPLRDGAGNVVGINVVIEETTVRKAAEAALRQLNETLEQRVAERTSELEAISAERARLASIAENSPDFIGICDLDLRVTYLNPAGRRLVGIERDEELQLRKPPEYVLPEERARVEHELFPALLRQGHWIGELTFQHFRTNERIPVLCDAFRIDDPASGEPSHYATVTRDLRERKQAEERLLRAQKMEAVGQLTGGIAHDFNNLLTVIAGNLELLRPRVADQPRLDRLVADMQYAAERGERLAAQLLAFSRRQKLRPETLDINLLFQRFQPMIRGAVGESVQIEAHFAPDLWPCTIDAAQLEAALLNLAVNARDAMPRGGRLTVETRNVGPDDRLRAKMAGAGPGPYVVIAVSDTGSGMPPAVVARAFEPFFTTKEVGKGTGLGLSQVYGFVEQSGGQVTIESTVGQGTTIRLYLPAAATAAATPRTRARRDARLPGGSERILIVEDNPHVLRTADAMITDLGYETRTAAGPLEALEMLRAGGEAFDLLFSDVVMPQMSGIQLAEEARRIRPGLKVLLTSGHSRESLSALDESFNVIAKPYKHANLAAQLRAALDAR